MQAELHLCAHRSIKWQHIVSLITICRARPFLPVPAYSADHVTTSTPVQRLLPPLRTGEQTDMSSYQAQPPCGRPALIGLCLSYHRQRTRGLCERRCFIFPCFCCQGLTVVTFLIGEGLHPMEPPRSLGLRLGTSARQRGDHRPTKQWISVPGHILISRANGRAVNR